MSDDEIVHDWESDCYVLHAANTSLREERERLRAENSKLRDALRPFADAADDFIAEKHDAHRAIVTLGDLRRARAALEGVKEKEGAGNE